MKDGPGTKQHTTKRAILLTLTAGESPALGSIWRITAKRADFYLDTLGPTGDTMHVSLHGPQGDYDEHRFHLKIDRKAEKIARAEGNFIEHGVPRNGKSFRGQQVAEHVYQVVRLRWSWHMQRERYRTAAVFGNAPEIGEGVSGLRLRHILDPNSAWDVDLYISYNEPYWPTFSSIQRAKAHGDPRLGPLRNEAGHWLTGHSFVRSQLLHPSPGDLVPRLPSSGETPNRLTCGGLGKEDMYWFVETITALEFLELARSVP